MNFCCCKGDIIDLRKLALSRRGANTFVPREPVIVYHITEITYRSLSDTGNKKKRDPRLPFNAPLMTCVNMQGFLSNFHSPESANGSPRSVNRHGGNAIYSFVDFYESDLVELLLAIMERKAGHAANQ